ncbi:cell division protein ZapE [Roseomonas elaeocarpi]|uniref:Cell division protein ZapE n=1 Tax=Roseomonas elaeocarpi TaxID=907779 RepID=A0ABV6JY87_9PROT
MDGSLSGQAVAGQGGTSAAGPLAAYRARVAAGTLREDPAQEDAARRLQELWQRTRGYVAHRAPAPAAGGGLIGRLFGRRPAAAATTQAPTGLYLVGEVGRGKSMLMDLFFETAEVERKRRIHFHQFMQDCHRSIHQWKQANPGADDPIPPLADTIVETASLLCFDEFQVHDITDAMILGRLFAALFERGVVVVATSNTAPDDLFKGRPGRDAFLPFIALIKARTELLVLDSRQDYRRDRVRGLPTWHQPDDARAERALDAAFRELTGRDHGEPVKLLVLGREVVIPQAVGEVGRAGFDELCGSFLGPADFLAIAARFHTLILDGVPRLGPENFDRARRFVTLIDALYEHRCKLVASAAATPDTLYERGENAHMFQRTASRLMEMQSQDYLALPHITQDA